MVLADMHTHILPGVDDGAKTWDDALKMLEQQVKNGVTQVVLTPHFSGRSLVEKQTVLEGMAKLKAAAAKAKLNITLHEGHEVMYVNAFNELLDRREYCTLAGSRYVLVELPLTYMNMPVQLLDDVFLSGVTPVLAHAERVAQLTGDMNAFESLCGCGVIVQVNAEALTDGIDRKTTKFVHKLIKNGLVHIIASDCHNFTDRQVNLGEAAAFVRKKFGEATAEKLFWENPMKIINNEDIE